MTKGGSNAPSFLGTTLSSSWSISMKCSVHVSKKAHKIWYTLNWKLMKIILSIAILLVYEGYIIMTSNNWEKYYKWLLWKSFECNEVISGIAFAKKIKITVPESYLQLYMTILMKWKLLSKLLVAYKNLTWNYYGIVKIHWGNVVGPFHHCPFSSCNCNISLPNLCTLLKVILNQCLKFSTEVVKSLYAKLMIIKIFWMLMRLDL